MSALISILRAVHCRSTHHFFAIDALARINTPNGRRLASVLLANYAEYLSGAKAPDTKFKDFQNHVIHVSDNCWGGAPKACEKWLAQAIVDMHESDWKRAAYDIGVLSHYFTDPLMPLHTAQHPSEAAVHRPLEWSVCKSYDRIYRKCTGQARFPIETGPNWISKAVLTGAEFAHQYYQTLIELYDLTKGAKDPPAGFDSRSREILTQIFDRVLTGWANVLDRVAALALVEIPICPLTFTTVMAAIDVPAAWVVGRVADAAEQRAVKAIFDEFEATGQVVRNLPPELKVIESLKPIATSSATVEEADSPVVYQSSTSPVQVVVPEPVVPEPVVQAAAAEADENCIEHEPTESYEPELSERRLDEPAAEISQPIDPVASQSQRSQNLGARQMSASSSRITLESDIVDAPSIGPKTAARFYAIGIDTIGDFLAADAAAMADALNAKWMDESVLRNWQAQTRLVLHVPALCGYKAQLLMGIECTTVDQLAAADLDSLYDAVDYFATTDAGTRILRSASPPTREEVAKWIASAAAAETSTTASASNE